MMILFDKVTLKLNSYNAVSYFTGVLFVGGADVGTKNLIEMT